MIDITQPPARTLIAASILSADFGCMAEECREILGKGADLIHVDVMDGHFVSNLTMGQDMCRGLRRHLAEAYLDVHLMIERPDLFISQFADAGANLVSFHLEVCQPARDGGINAVSTIDQIHNAGMHAGMAINPATPVELLEPYLSQLELVLVMSVIPGRSGQKFMPEVLEKVRWLKPRIGQSTRLEMDGGLNPETAPAAVAAGADMLVSASALFGAADRGDAITRLHVACS